MRVYQLEYRLRRKELSGYDAWLLAKEFFDIPDTQQVSTPDMDRYVAQFYDLKYPPIIEWFGSEREAVVRRIALFDSGVLKGKKLDHKIWAVDIPTDKRSLLAWLQENWKAIPC